MKRSPNADRPFPWRCRHCGNNEVVMGTINYDAEVRHDGRLHQFNIPNLELPICRACGEKVFTENVDDQVNDALRSYLNLLTPNQIHERINQLAMSQKDVAKVLGIAEATLSRWLNKTQIQSRAMDNLLRIFFNNPRAIQGLGTTTNASRNFMVDDSATQNKGYLKPPRNNTMPSFSLQHDLAKAS